jgi:hypothetical protein
MEWKRNGGVEERERDFVGGTEGAEDLKRASF